MLIINLWAIKEVAFPLSTWKSKGGKIIGLVNRALQIMEVVQREALMESAWERSTLIQPSLKTLGIEKPCLRCRSVCCSTSWLSSYGMNRVQDFLPLEPGELLWVNHCNDLWSNALFGYKGSPCMVIPWSTTVKLQGISQSAPWHHLTEVDRNWDLINMKHAIYSKFRLLRFCLYWAFKDHL